MHFSKRNLKMEIIIALVVAFGLGYLFFFRKKEEVAVSAPEVTPVPYKVETPTVVEVAPVVEEVKVEAPAPVVEAVAETPVKKTRKPRAPKAETTEKKAAPKKAAAKSKKV